MDFRIIARVEPNEADAQHPTLHFKDGTSAVFHAFSAHPTEPAVLLAIVRDADGAPTDDGPLVTTDLRRMLAACGVTP